MAAVIYLSLIDENPDNIEYLLGLEKAKLLSEPLNEKQVLAKIYRDLSAKYPKSHILYRLPLNHATGKDFGILLDAYLVKMFRKGVPSLFKSFKDLVQNREKCLIIQNVVETYVINLKAKGRFHAENKAKESPTVYLWVIYFLAQLNDFLDNTEMALELIDIAIDHSPTAVELYMAKARILKVKSME